jgi:uncharacterized membrane protein
MPEIVKSVAEWCAAAIELIGLAVIVFAALYAVKVVGTRAVRSSESRGTALETARQGLGRGILLGLEFFVAADIIHTVAVDLSLNSVAVLAIVVLIRTFLSVTLNVELTGRWPWQRAEDTSMSQG